MVALETAARAEGSAQAAVRRSRGGWLLATAGVLAVGSFGPLVAAPGIGHLSAAVLSLLVGMGAAAVALALGSARQAFVVAVGVVALLGLGRLPARPGPGYEEPQALWRTDQTIAATLEAAAGEPPARLVVLAQPVLAGDSPRFGITANVNGRSMAWRCPFQAGVVQWLELPFSGPPPAGLAGAGRLDVQVGLSGAPSRDQDYLLVYHSTDREGLLVGLQEERSVSAPVTVCAPA